MDKKRERRILEFVYDLTQMDNVAETEGPDFLLFHQGIAEPFGVEVTDFYRSGAKARLDNITNYFQDLLHESKFRHKEDKQALEISDMELYSPDGEFKGNARGILQRGGAIVDIVDLLTEAIRKKEAKTSQYLTKCRHINLIVFDTEQFLRRVPIDDYFGLLYSKPLRNLLFETSFREVFLVTQLAGERWVYISLLMVLLVSEAFKFQQILLGESLPPFESQRIIEQLDAINDFDDLVPFFAAYLSRKTDRVFLHTIRQHPTVVFGNTSISLSDKTHNIYDQSDLPWPVSLRQAAWRSYSWMFNAPDFRERERTVEEERSFSTQLVADVVRKVDFSDLSEPEETVQYTET